MCTSTATRSPAPCRPSCPSTSSAKEPDVEIVEMLQTPLMQRALLAALLVGIVAPVMGTYLVQRKLSLLGDGIGHVALTGVALGWLVGAAMGLVPQDALAIPGAVVTAVLGAVGIEV